MESIKNLILNLESMIEVHTRLLGLAKEKRKILISGDIQSLQSLIQLESTCADKIQKLEQQRKHMVNEYLFQKGIKSESFTLDELMTLQEVPELKATLHLVAKQLRNLVQEITHLNESNQQLLQTSLSYLQFSIGMHVRKEPAAGYGPNSTSRYLNLLDAKA
jgi:hypothetical protein